MDKALAVLRAGLRLCAIVPLGMALASCSGLGLMSGIGDAKPHVGVASAHLRPVHGVDISRWQGKVDWAALRDGGTRFAFIKATEGGDHIDPRFAENWQGARNAGVLRGAYHFMYWCLAEEAVDVLFTDIDLGGRDGCDLAQRALNAQPGLAVVITSGRSRRCHEGRIPPGAAFLAKPYRLEHLFGEVQRATQAASPQ